MRMRYFGDSYDIVKQSLLRWLRGFGERSAHPMFTQPVSDADVAAFEKLLAVKVVSRNVLTVDTNRTAYLAPASSCGHLFLDPDTGLRMRPTRGVRAPEYLFANELVRLADARPASLTVVFDQSVRRGSEPLHRVRAVAPGGKAPGAASPRVVRVCLRLPCMLPPSRQGPRASRARPVADHRRVTTARE